MNSRSITLILLLLLQTGCASISSTFLHRDECNTSWEHKKLKGMPITLKVPTHVRVDVVETRYVRECDDGYQYACVGTTPIAQYDVERTTITTEKIFTVDLKRPGAGTMKYTANLSAKDQYFNTITSDLNDITIQESSKAFERILGAFPKLTQNSGTDGGGGPKPQNAATPALIPMPSVVASSVFDLDDPAFEENVRIFVGSSLATAKAELEQEQCATCKPVARPHRAASEDTGEVEAPGEIETPGLEGIEESGGGGGDDGEPESTEMARKPEWRLRTPLAPPISEPAALPTPLPPASAVEQTESWTVPVPIRGASR